MSQAAPAKADPPVAFGPFTLHIAQRLLLDGGRPVRLGARARGILAALVERAGEVVSKSELIAYAWPDGDAEEATLRVHMGALRKVLGDGQGGVRYIASVAGRGYCFVAPVVRHGSVDVAGTAPAIPHHNLPARATRVIGRDDLIAALAQSLPLRRLLTLCGPGGMGKTTIALAMAERLLPAYADGVRFVDLGRVADPGLVNGALAATLGMTAGAAAPPVLVDALRDKRMLVVLDSCEHVIDAVAMLVLELQQAAPDVHVLVTSREPLQCEGEWVQRVPPLALPAARTRIDATEAMRYAAIQLFVERAIHSADTFQLPDADAAGVVELCASLDGMPLAIELAAAQVSTFGIQALRRLLSDRFQMLAHNSAIVLPRHRTLRALLDWSYDGLSARERTTLMRLSIFNGEFTLAWARAVLVDPGFDRGDVEAGIAALVAKSLVSADASEPVVRYRLLATTRAYAHERLAEAGALRALRARHAMHWRIVLMRTWLDEPELTQAEWASRYGVAIDDVRAAITWALSADGDAELGARLIIAALPLAYFLSRLDEFCGYAARALALADDGAATLDATLTTRLRVALGTLIFHTRGLAAGAEEAYDRALDASVALPQAGVRQQALTGVGMLALAMGDYAGGQRHAESMGALAAHDSDPMSRLWADHMLALAHHYQGHHGTARRLAERVRAHPSRLARPVDNLTALVCRRVCMQIVLARTLWLEGHADRAAAMADRCVEDALHDMPLALAQALAFAACPIALWRGDEAALCRYATRLREHSARHALVAWHGWVELLDTALKLRDANADTPGLDASRQALLARITHTGAKQVDLYATFGATFLTPLAIDRAQSGVSGWCMAEVRRVAAEADPRRHTTAGRVMAAATFAEVIALARQQGALAWELRAATSLARVRLEQGDASHAADVLAHTCTRVTEGHDTADYRAARALLATCEAAASAMRDASAASAASAALVEGR
ncbi:Predicted ATPase [Cupriavidus sp. YR651]|uniref:ATP-binding protein n=1 Tax=Cupriavidus sp. YR651 TaxID=1855315 RepID=UPI00088EB409|nr:winged helix-turn-helix domain-containing protein [Cupriavidus sp. YR651]SDC62841.1 Predicted ATPase [Cupriavidus sp. YR651]